MHDSVKRLFDFAKRKTAGQPRPIETFTDLQSRLQISSATLTNWKERGVSKGGAIKAEQELGCSVGWVLTGEGGEESAAPPAPAFPSGAMPVNPSKENRVVVIGKGAGGLPERIWDDAGHPVGSSDRYGLVYSSDPHAFLVEVSEESMVPKYTPGDFALVEPGTDPELEDDVLVRLSTGETMIKRLLSRRGAYRFGSYNTTVVMHYRFEDVDWIYYVPYPVPRKKIKSRT